MFQPEGTQNPMEGEVFYPQGQITENANVPEYEMLYQQSLQDPQGFCSWKKRMGSALRGLQSDRAPDHGPSLRR